MNMAIGGGAERFSEASGRHDRLAPAAAQVRHGAAARLAERRCKASCLGQVETHDGYLSPKPPQRRCLHKHLAGMRGPGRFPAARAMTVQEMIEWSLDLERDRATKAAPSKCRHARLLGRYGARHNIRPANTKPARMSGLHSRISGGGHWPRARQSDVYRVAFHQCDVTLALQLEGPMALPAATLAYQNPSGIAEKDRVYIGATGDPRRGVDGVAP